MKVYRDEDGVGFMGGTIKNSMHIYFVTKGNKKGVIYSDVNGEFLHINPDNIIWHTNERITMRREVRGIMIINNVVDEGLALENTKKWWEFWKNE